VRSDEGTPVKFLETDRLQLRQPALSDADFVLRLLNEPTFLEHIGDRGVRTHEQARVYLQERMMASFERFGLGMFVVLRGEDGAVAGLCGLVQREELDDVDLGFALLPEFCSLGYAKEACQAVLAHAKSQLRLARLVAIVAPTNARSISLLGKLGFRFERKVRMAADDEEIELHGIDLSGMATAAEIRAPWR